MTCSHCKTFFKNMCQSVTFFLLMKWLRWEKWDQKECCKYYIINKGGVVSAYKNSQMFVMSV